MIDLRSDTVTKPSPEMLDAMMSAKVGDDVFGEDYTVQDLEEKTAELLGAEAGLFCPSGTMTNQIGIKVLSSPYEEIICYKGAHIYKYEGGGVAGTSGLSFKLLEGKNGILSAKEIEQNINPDDIYSAKTSIIALENTVNSGGGCYYKLPDILKIDSLARQYNLKIHLDGARLFNALVASGDRAKDYGKPFDTISVCLSKGLGAPVGSVLVGKQKWITKARKVRKYMGGGMRQAGYLAAAGLYALENNIERLKDDHIKAKEIGKTLDKCSIVKEVKQVDTNIVIFTILDTLKVSDVLHKLKDQGLLATAFGPHDIRMVTHLDFDDDQLTQTLKIIASFN
jgi:threonine aldolase